MTVLTIRGYPKKVQLSTEGNGVYNIARYEMGRPSHEIANSMFSRIEVTDSITFNIVAKSKTELARHVSILYKSLHEAVYFYNATTRTPCYLESVVPEQNGPVYACISAFEFHQLNDPYDGQNGKIIQDAILSITRTAWSDIPPQPDPMGLIDNVGRDISNDRFVPISLPLHGPEADFYNYDDNRVPYVAEYSAANKDQVLFLSNVYRQNNVTVVGGIGTVDQQADVYVAPYQIGSSSAAILTIYVGAFVRFNGVHFNLSKGFNHGGVNPTVQDITVSYSAAGGTWVDLADNVVVDYAEFARTGHIYIGWKEIGTAWILATTVASKSAYYIRLRVRSKVGSVTVLPEQTGGIIATPDRPFFDIKTPRGGDLPTRLMMRIFNLQPWIYLDQYYVEGSDQLLYSPYHMNSLILASERIDDLSAPERDPGVGFYNLSLSGYFGVEALNYTDEIIYHSGQVMSVLALNVTSASATDYTPSVSLNVPARPGSYRMFVRYRVQSSPAPSGTVFLRASISPTSVEWISTGRPVHSSTFGVDMTGTMVQDSLCLADLGVFSIAPDVMRLTTSMNYTIKITLETYKTTGATGSLILYDVIMLPINEHYTVFEGARPPLPRNWDRKTPGKRQLADDYIPTLAEEALIISNLEPTGTVAFIGREREVQQLVSGEDYETIAYDRSISESFFKFGPAQFATEPDHIRRFYMLWYKAIPEGTILSYDGFHTAIQLYGAKQFMVLPAR